MPVHSMPGLRLPAPDHRAYLDRMPGSSIPVIRQPFAPGDMLPFWAMTQFTGNHLLDLLDDPSEQHDMAGAKGSLEQAREREAEALMVHALEAIESPDDQFVRLGLS
jgi:hypothetical protein